MGGIVIILLIIIIWIVYAKDELDKREGTVIVVQRDQPRLALQHIDGCLQDESQHSAHVKARNHRLRDAQEIVTLADAKIDKV